MANSKGSVDQKFADRIAERADQADRIAGSARGQGQRPWQVPAGWSGDPLDVAGAVAPFDRASLVQAYGAITAGPDDPGTVGDVVAVKGQGDYIAMIERGFRARHASPVRCMAHATARRKGHGDANGVFRGVVTTFFQRSVKAGGS